MSESSSAVLLFAGHHTIYIGVHVPKSYRRRRRHRRRTSHKDRKERLIENASDKSDTENNDEASNSILKPLSKFWWTPCQDWLEPMSVFAEGCSLFQKKRPCNSLWPHRSCWVHLVARNSHACPSEWQVCFDRAEWIFTGSNGYSNNCTSADVSLLSTVFKCMPSFAFVLGCRHKCICLCVCAVVLASICVRAGSSWLTGV